MPESTASPVKKRVVTKGYTKSPRINYHRFYAIKFSVELEQQEPQNIRAFFNISSTTFNRILQSKDYVAYKRLLGTSHVGGSEQRPPADMPVQPKQHRKPIAETQVRPIDQTLEKAKQVLELAETILDQANKNAAHTPAKRGLFGRK